MDQFSYNLGISTSLFLLCPRVDEGGQIGSGSLALNGSILAGGLMVKGQSEWEALQTNSSLLDGLLSKIGIPVRRNNEGKGVI
jgi:ATP adenylyltransferase